MTSLHHDSTTSTSPAMPSQTFDIDQYLDLDHTAGPSPSISPANTKTFPVPSPTPIGVAGQLQQPPTQTFSGPSHQYEQYKQQTGLPVGALANTFALNDPERFQYPASYNLNSGTDGYFGMNTVEPDLVDFNTVPGQTPTDVEMDYGNVNLSNPNFVNPSAVSGVATPTYAQTSHPGRVWPGMHQQAAMAKAQQQAALAAQRQRSASIPSRRPSAVDERESEEVVEESISRLLSRMRNNSVASSAHEDGGSGGGSGGHAYHARSRKDEEDMDEDERLLASEEGKKLSSKERRQLRNKVSARAFRSRRKEYIGQLEGELATKSAEADDLRAKNQELLAENSRLTDLTRMLLSSPAFSDFLNDLSGTGLNASTIQGLAQSRQQSQTPRATSQKDANPSQYNLSHSNQNTTHIGMTMIPEEPHLEADHPSNNGYNPAAGNNGMGLYDAQVYAIPSMTESPSIDAIDFTLLNDKTAHGLHLHAGTDSTECKDQPEMIECVPVPNTPISTTSSAQETTVEEEHNADDDFEIIVVSESDPSYALFADDLPAVVSKTAAVSQAEVEEDEERTQLFGTIPLAKAVGRIDLVLTSEGDDLSQAQAEVANTKALLKFDRLCREMDVLAGRIEMRAGHVGN